MMNVCISSAEGPAWAPTSEMNDTSPPGALIPYVTRSPADGIAMRSRTPSTNGSGAARPARAGRLDAAGQPASPALTGRRSRRAGRIEEVIEERLLGRRAAGHPSIRSAGGLAVVGKHVEIVAILGHAPQDPPQPVDRGVDATERPERAPGMRAPRVRDHVVVEVVHVDRADAGVEIVPHRQREELTQPHRDADL